MRLRRSDFVFPPGRQRCAWRDLHWALRRLATQDSLYTPGSVFWREEASGARAILYWCARHAATPRGMAALQARVPACVWAETTRALAVWPPGHASSGTPCGPGGA